MAEWGDAEVAAALRAEWRDEQDAAARDALEQWQHGRTLREVAISCMHRGDSVTVTIGAARFAGRVVEVGHDVLALMTASGRVEVHLHASVPIVVRASPSGRDGTAGPTRGTFRACLLGREGSEVRIGVTAVTEPMTGRLTVGADHAGVVDELGNRTWAPLHCVAWVAPRT